LQSYKNTHATYYKLQHTTMLTVVEIKDESMFAQYNFFHSGLFIQSERKSGFAQLLSSFIKDVHFRRNVALHIHFSFILDDSSGMYIQSEPCKLAFT
jgi:hypothetical protein